MRNPKDPAEIERVRLEATRTLSGLSPDQQWAVVAERAEAFAAASRASLDAGFALVGVLGVLTAGANRFGPGVMAGINDVGPDEATRWVERRRLEVAAGLDLGALEPGSSSE